MMMKSILALVCCGFTMGASANEWPQEIIAEEGTIIVCQPQPVVADIIAGRR